MYIYSMNISENLHIWSQRIYQQYRLIKCFLAPKICKIYNLFISQTLISQINFLGCVTRHVLRSSWAKSCCHPALTFVCFERLQTHAQIKVMMPIRWPMSLYNCLRMYGCVCVCVLGAWWSPMTYESGAIFLVQLTTRQFEHFAGHSLRLALIVVRAEGGRWGGGAGRSKGRILLLYSMLLIKFCCRLPTLLHFPLSPRFCQQLLLSCALFLFRAWCGGKFL